jgi:hypothetical protein
MSDHAFFYLGLTFILLHELDAMRCHEWRILPGLSLMSERNGFVAFLFLHVPLFYWILRSLAIPEGRIQFMNWFSAFLIAHLVAHVIYLRHRNNEFRDWISWTIIIGAAAFGGLHLGFGW